MPKGHYQHVKRGETLEQRFMRHVLVAPNDECWLWQASLVRGYGQFVIKARKPAKKAHRVSWELFVGPIPDDLSVLHKCDVRACVRPSHLFLGTLQDNTDDMISKGRQYFPGRPSKMTAADKEEALQMLNEGMTKVSIAAFFGIDPAAISRLAGAK